MPLINLAMLINC